MDQIISRCGNICTDCPWSMFVRKRIRKEDWKEYGKQIKKYIGFVPVKYEWEGCVGCLTPDDQLPKQLHYGFLKKCRTRKCVKYNEIETCAHCSRFPCANTVSKNNINKTSISQKLGEEISDDDYDKYIRMFDSMRSMNSLRETISANQIKKPKIVPYRTKNIKIANFFKNSDLRPLHNKLTEIVESNLRTDDIDTIAGLERYKVRKEFILKLLWVIGLYGQFKDEVVRLDSITLYTNMKPITLPKDESDWKLYFEILSDLGIFTNFEFMTDELYTPGGWMRVKTPKSNDPSYHLSINFEPQMEKEKFFECFHKFLTEIQDKNGKRAYSVFKNVLM